MHQRYYDRALRNVYRDGDCLISKFTTNGAGYPKMNIEGGKKALVHRVAWEAVNGPIPKGMTVDHKACNNPMCVNPEHLQLLTLSQNKIKSNASGVWKPGTCKRGHDDSFRVSVTCYRAKTGEPYQTTVCSECRRERKRGKQSKTL